MEKKEFVLTAIKKLRSDRSKGIHTVYSGFNNAFRAQFAGEDPRETTDAMAAAGELEIRPTKGGVMIYIPGEAPEKRDFSGAEALKKILAE